MFEQSYSSISWMLLERKWDCFAILKGWPVFNQASERYISRKYLALISVQPWFKCLSNPTHYIFMWPGMIRDNISKKHRSWLALSKISFSEPNGTLHILKNDTTGVLSVMFIEDPLMGWTIGWGPHKEIHLLCNTFKKCQMKKGPFEGHMQNLSRI